MHRGKDLSAGELSYFFADTLTRKDVDKIFDIDSISDMEEEYEKLPYLWSTSYSTRAFCYQVAVAKGINPKEFNGELLYKMAEEGDPVVLDMLEDFYFTTAKYLFNIFAIVDPDIILLGGGISACDSVEGVKRYVEKLKSISMITNFIKVDVCKFGNDLSARCALQLPTDVPGKLDNKKMFPRRFERPTYRLGGGCSILLSYGNKSLSIFIIFLIGGQYP